MSKATTFRLLAALAVLATAVFLSGCRLDDGPGGERTGATTGSGQKAVATTGHVEGTVYRISDQADARKAGTATAAHTTGPGLVVSGSEPPTPGAEPVSDADVMMAGSAQATTTDENGFFRIELPAGAASLVISEDADSMRRPVTVVAGTTVTPGVSSLDRSAAYSRVEEAVIDDLERPDTVLVLGSQNPLPAGTVVSNVDPAETGDFDAVTLDNRSWLFLVDLFVTSAYGHPVRYVLVDDTSGAVTVLERHHPPRVNNNDLWFSRQDKVEADILLAPTSDPRVSRPIATEEGPTVAALRVDNVVPANQHVEGCEDSDNYAIYITGTTEVAFSEATQNFAAALSPEASRDVAPTRRASFEEAFRVQFRAINEQMTPCDRLIVYVASHGGWDDSVDAAGENFEYKRTDASLGDDQSEWINGQDLVQPMREINACHLQIIVDVCYSQSMLDLIEQVLKFNEFDKVESLVVLSAASNASALYGDISSGNETAGVATGGKFTNELIDAGVVGSPEQAVKNMVDSLVATPGTFASDQGAVARFLPATEECRVADGGGVMPPPEDQPPGGGDDTGGDDTGGGDTDGDGIDDDNDNCPNGDNPSQFDRDQDGVGSACDNCKFDENPAQTDSDGDDVGDICDNCPDTENFFQDDSDGDGIGDACDNCPDSSNSDQTDADGDGEGDACDDPDEGVVVLDYDLSSEYQEGDRIELSRIDGHFVRGPVNDNCEVDHLHDPGSEGIFIDGDGPFQDRAPFQCGYGEVIGHD